MYKIEFKNASVRDIGYGLDVNGKPLSEIISTLLGTKAGEKIACRDEELDMFSHNSCDITVIIEPHNTTEWLEADDLHFNEVEELEEFMNEQFEQKCKTADTEE